MSDVFSYIVVPVLVPVIPAYILFKFLPGKASINGKVKNVKINLVGGFGGYFAILWILLPYVNGLRPQPVPKQPKQQYQVYTVTGTVILEGRTSLPDDQVTFTAVLPSAYSVNPPNGGFSVNIPVGPGPGSATSNSGIRCRVWRLARQLPWIFADISVATLWAGWNYQSMSTNLSILCQIRLVRQHKPRYLYLQREASEA